MTPGKKRPTGGDGGRGGDVYIVADRGLNGMAFNTFHFNAGNGKNGGSKYHIHRNLTVLLTDKISMKMRDI